MCKSNRVVLNAYRNVYFSNYSRLFTSVPSFYYRSFADEAQSTETNGNEASGNETQETEVDKEKTELKNKIIDLENDVHIYYIYNIGIDEKNERSKSSFIS